MLSGALPVLLGDPEARVDMVPRDLVARAIVAAVEGTLPTGAWWLTLGEDAPRLQELVALCATRSGSLVGCAVPPARCLDASAWAACGLSARRRALPEQLAPYLLSATPLPSDLPLAGGDGLLLARPCDPLALFDAALHAWVRGQGAAEDRTPRTLLAADVTGLASVTPL